MVRISVPNNIMHWSTGINSLVTLNRDHRGKGSSSSTFSSCKSCSNGVEEEEEEEEEADPLVSIVVPY